MAPIWLKVSQTPVEQLFIMNILGGFGPVCPNGLGIGYIVGKDWLGAFVHGFKVGNRFSPVSSRLKSKLFNLLFPSGFAKSRWLLRNSIKVLAVDAESYRTWIWTIEITKELNRRNKILHGWKYYNCWIQSSILKFRKDFAKVWTFWI